MIKNITPIILAILLITSVFYLWNDNRNKERELIEVNGKVYELLSREVEVVEVEKIVTEYRDGNTIYVEVEVPVQVFIPAQVDTMEVLKDFYSKRIYSDTLFVEDLGFVALIDTVSQNKITGRSYNASIRERTVTETVTVKELPKLEIWIGFTATSLGAVGGSLGIVTKSRTHIGLDAGIYIEDQLIYPYLGIRYMWQIK